MSSGNSFADNHESLDQANLDYQYAFQSWLDEYEDELRERYSNLLGAEQEFSEDDFIAWAEEQYEQASK